MKTSPKSQVIPAVIRDSALAENENPGGGLAVLRSGFEQDLSKTRFNSTKTQAQTLDTSNRQGNVPFTRYTRKFQKIPTHQSHQKHQDTPTLAGRSLVLK